MLVKFFGLVAPSNMESPDTTHFLAPLTRWFDMEDAVDAVGQITTSMVMDVGSGREAVLSSAITCINRHQNIACFLPPNTVGAFLQAIKASAHLGESTDVSRFLVTEERPLRQIIPRTAGVDLEKAFSEKSGLRLYNSSKTKTNMVFVFSSAASFARLTIAN